MQRSGALAIALVLLVSCGDDGSETASDPWGLTSVEMPTTQDEVTAALVAMPDEIGGLARQEDGAEDHVATVDYGGEDEGIGLSLFAVPGDSRPAADDGRSVSPATFIAGMIEEGVIEVTSSAVDPSGSLVWMAGSSTFTDEPGIEITAYVVVWGEPDGEWLFFSTSDTIENRDAFIEAFVAAVGG